MISYAEGNSRAECVEIGGARARAGFPRIIYYPKAYHGRINLERRASAGVGGGSERQRKTSEETRETTGAL